MTTDGAGEGELSLLVLNDQPDKALLAVDMEALEYLWVSVGVQTNGAVELLIYFLDCFLQPLSTSCTIEKWVGGSDHIVSCD